MATVVSIFCLLASFIVAEAAKEQNHALELRLATKKKKEGDNAGTGKQTETP